MLPEPTAITKYKKRTPKWKEIYDYKAKIGTLVHFRILNPLSPARLELPDFSIDEFPEDAFDLADIGEIIFKSMDLEIGEERYVEHSVLSEKYKYGGKVDLVARVRCKKTDEEMPLTVIDLKTSKSVYDKHLLQLAAYYIALKEQGIKPDAGAILLVHPYIKNNPRLIGHLYPVSKIKLEQLGQEFLDLLEQFYAENRHLSIPGCLPGENSRCFIHPTDSQPEEETRATATGRTLTP